MVKSKKKRKMARLQKNKANYKILYYKVETQKLRRLHIPSFYIQTISTDTETILT